jgi:NTE family protein
VTETRNPPSSPTIALALGAGGARGLAHIAVLEAFDELGLKPTVIAGASMGAVLGAAYASGLPARTIRTHARDILRDRATLMAAVFEARIGKMTDVFSGFGNPLLVDPELFLARLWRGPVPRRFEDLEIPFMAVATDYYGRTEALFHEGPLAPALAASIAIPGLAQPVRHQGRLLIDGGAVNPLPFDHLIGRAGLLVAVDVTGGPTPHPTRAPAPFEVMFGSLQIMQAAIVKAKLKIYRPEIVLQPAVDAFRVLDFFELGAILAAAEPAKEALKRELERHLESPRPTR